MGSRLNRSEDSFHTSSSVFESEYASTVNSAGTTIHHRSLPQHTMNGLPRENAVHFFERPSDLSLRQEMSWSDFLKLGVEGDREREIPAQYEFTYGGGSRMGEESSVGRDFEYLINANSSTQLKEQERHFDTSRDSTAPNATEYQLQRATTASAPAGFPTASLLADTGAAVNFLDGSNSRFSGRLSLDYTHHPQSATGEDLEMLDIHPAKRVREPPREHLKTLDALNGGGSEEQEVFDCEWSAGESSNSVVAAPVQAQSRTSTPPPPLPLLQQRQRQLHASPHSSHQHHSAEAIFLHSSPLRPSMPIYLIPSLPELNTTTQQATDYEKGYASERYVTRLAGTDELRVHQQGQQRSGERERRRTRNWRGFLRFVCCG